MDEIELNEALMKKLYELKAKYRLTGQDLVSNLEGLLHSNYLKYWDYIHLDTLLSLQSPRTDFPDEKIFIVIHQINELYFNLILWEIDQIAHQNHPQASFFNDRLKRIIRYFANLIQAMDVMVEGLDTEQFKKFRMALLPSSGFQSAQFRKIEICSTDFYQLIQKPYQSSLSEKADVAEIFQYLYWLKGATDQGTGKETITSQHFQEHYREEFVRLARLYRDRNLWQCYLQLPPGPELEESRQLLKEYDQMINVQWRMGHLKAAGRHLRDKSTTIEATGGTNWPRYLPPRFQRTIFYPRLWTDEEMENWGHMPSNP